MYESEDLLLQINATNIFEHKSYNFVKFTCI